MSVMPPHTYEALCEKAAWPLSRLYHEHSKLSEYKVQQFAENIEAFEQDEAALRNASRSFKSYPTRPTIGLARDLRRFGGGRLRNLLRRRRTRRGQFSAPPMTLRILGALLDAACGITGTVTHPQHPDITQELRAWPSGGALYPIEVYIGALGIKELDRALYHYDAKSHQLTKLGACPDDTRLQEIIYAEGMWDGAAAIIVLTAVFARTQVKYGERGYRFILLDAGHLAQNILLTCEDLDLAAIPLGGFHDEELGRLLELEPSDEAPVYAILIGNMRR